jgi:diguanylate cyclase (GGDEF)-like protein
MLSPLPGRRRDDGTLAPAAPGEPAYCLILRDITDKRALSENLRSATYGDHLTGLANRRAFFEAGELEMLRRTKMPQAPALILIDADHFKAINDSHGHPAGDAVLRHLGATLKSMFRQVDTVARIGGEEFAAILPGASLADAAIVAERLRERVQAGPAMFDGAAIAYTISIGVAAMDDPACTLAGFLQRADDALYAAKRGGRNRVVCWPAEGEVQA